MSPDTQIAIFTAGFLAISAGAGWAIARLTENKTRTPRHGKDKTCKQRSSYSTR